MELFFYIETEFTLNWIVWNRTVLKKTILKRNWILWIRTVWLKWIAWQLNSVLMLNWINWNRTVYLYKSGFVIKITYKGWYAIKPKQTNRQKFPDNLCPILISNFSDSGHSNAILRLDSYRSLITLWSGVSLNLLDRAPHFTRVRIAM